MLKAFASYAYSDLSLHIENLDNLSVKDFLGIRSDNYYTNINYGDLVGDDLTIFTGASFSYDKDKFNLNSDIVKQDEQLSQVKITITKQAFGSSFITFGSEIQDLVYKSSFNELAARLDELTAAGFLETDIYFTNDFAAKIGMRGEHSKSLESFNLAPRISLAYRLGAYDQLNFAFGKFYQTPDKDLLIQSKDFTFEDATHYIFNYQYIGTHRTFRIELYYKDYNNLAKGTLYNNSYINLPDVPFGSYGKGYAKGADIFWRDQETISLTDYWISYSYLDTKRDFLNYKELARPTFSTPHTFSVVIKHWVPQITTSFGLTYTFATGRPYFNPNNQEFLRDKTKNYNNLSLNASYLTTVFNSFTVIFFSVDNLIGFRNVFGYRYSTDGTVSRPVLPPALRTVFLGIFISVGQASPF